MRVWTGVDPRALAAQDILAALFVIIGPSRGESERGRVGLENSITQIKARAAPRSSHKS